MENFVGAIFFVTLLTGLSMLLWSKRHPKYSPQAHRLRKAGLVLEGFSFLWFSLLTGYFLQTSPHPVVEGTIGALQQNRSSEFTVVADSGDRAAIRCSYHGTGLQMGERIRVHYIQYNHRLLDAEILSGSVTGWHFSEPGETIQLVVFGLVGVVLLIAGFVSPKKAQETAESN